MTDHSASGVLSGQPTTVKKFLNFRWWFIVIPLLLITLMGQIDKVSISVVISDKKFLQDLNLIGRPAVTGMLMSGFLLSYAIFFFLWGYLVKRFGPRKCAIVGIIIWGLTLILSGLARTASAMITARIILGVGEAFIFPVSNAFVANWFPLKERARANSIWLNGTTFGHVVSGALTVAVIVAGGWRMVFFVLSAMSILIPLPMLIFLMRDRPRQQPRVSEAEARHIEEGSWAKTKEIPHAAVAEGKWGYLGNYRFWLITFAFGFNNVYNWGWSTWMPTYFRTARHFSFGAAGYLYSMSFMFALVAVVTVSYFSDRTMRRAPFGAVGWILASILMYIGGTVITNPYWALAFLVMALCCQHPAFFMIHTLLHSVVPEHSIGAASGVCAGVASLMSVISPAFIGFLLQISGFGAVIAFLALSSFFAGLLFIPLVKQGY